MKRKFIIIDPGLIRLGGHNYTLAVNFSDAAHALGYDVLWFCHKTFPTALVPDYVRADAVFSLSYYKTSRLRWLRVRLYDWLSDRLAGMSPPSPRAAWLSRWVSPYARELEAALDRHRVAATDHAFITTAEYLQYAALLSLFAAGPRDRLPFFHVRTSYDESAILNSRFGARLPGLFRRFRDLGVVNSRVYFYAETATLAAHYGRLDLVSFEALENPAPSRLPAAARVRRGDDAERPLTIICPGQARTEKGYLRLPAIIAALQARADVSRPFRIVLQSYLRASGKNDRARRKDVDRRAATNALRRFPNTVVRLLEQPLTNDAYYTLFAEGDIVLLPYDREHYRHRSSMVASEAALFGKPMVVTADTAMAAAAQPGASESAGTDEAFAAALAKIINDYGAYEAAAAARAETLHRRLDGRALVDRMIERTGRRAGGCQGTTERPDRGKQATPETDPRTLGGA